MRPCHVEPTRAPIASRRPVARACDRRAVTRSKAQPWTNRASLAFDACRHLPAAIARSSAITGRSCRVRRTRLYFSRLSLRGIQAPCAVMFRRAAS